MHRLRAALRLLFWRLLTVLLSIPMILLAFLVAVLAALVSVPRNESEEYWDDRIDLSKFRRWHWLIVIPVALLGLRLDVDERPRHGADLPEERVGVEAAGSD